jgi:hypothetical protein
LSNEHLHQALQVIITTKQLFREYVVDIYGFEGSGALIEDMEAEREDEPVQPSTVQDDYFAMKV